jgi:hypothetical protein
VCLIGGEDQGKGGDPLLHRERLFLAQGHQAFRKAVTGKGGHAAVVVSRR